MIQNNRLISEKNLMTYFEFHAVNNFIAFFDLILSSIYHSFFLPFFIDFTH